MAFWGGRKNAGHKLSHMSVLISFLGSLLALTITKSIIFFQ